MPGSIEKRSENSYRLVVSDGNGPEKKRKKYTKTVKIEGKTDAEKRKKAEKELAKFIAQIESNTFIEPSKLTFEDFIKKWISEYAEKNLAPKTLFRYKEMLNDRIIPALGHLKIDKLRPIHFIEFYNNLQEDGIRLDRKYSPKKDFNKIITDKKLTSDDILLKSGIDESTLKQIKLGKNVRLSTVNKICTSINIPDNILFDPVEQGKGLSPRTIKHHHRLIHDILEYAVKWQVISSNPSDTVDPPKVKKTEAKFYDENEVRLLINSLELVTEKDLKYKVAVIVTLSTGFRLGELTGLKWDNINFNNNTIAIDKANQYIPGKGTFTKAPKTETSIRTISVAKPVMDLLSVYKIKQDIEIVAKGDKWHKNGFVFTQWNGEPMYPGTPSRWFAKFLKEHKLKEITFHQLRHTSASILINEGVNISEVSKRLGHSNTSTTLNIYAHALKSADKDAADKIGNVIFSGNAVKSDEAK